MILDFTKRDKFDIKFLMRTAGYKKHPKGNGFIKEDETGRFHIKREKFNVFDLHYDINVGWRHLSIPMPERCGNEKNRLRQLSYKLFPHEFKVKIKKEKVLETYADVLRKQTPQLKKVKGLPTPPNPKKLKPKYADPAVVKAELARIKFERESVIHKKITLFTRLLNLLKVN